MLVATRKTGSRNGMLQVEWIDGTEMPQRAWVTGEMIESIEGDSVFVNDPERGIPHGVEWHRYIELSASAIDLGRELRKRGIWTTADLRENLEVVRGCLQIVYGVDLAFLLNLSKRLEKMEE